MAQIRKRRASETRQGRLLAVIGGQGALVAGLLAVLFQLTRRYGQALLELEEAEQRATEAPRAAVPVAGSGSERRGLMPSERAAPPGRTGGPARSAGEPPRVDLREQLYERGLALGSVGLNFELPGLDGASHTLGRLKGRPVLLIFIAPGCPHSRQLLRGLARLRRDDPARPTLLLVSSGDAEANRRLLAEFDLDLHPHPPLLVQGRNEVQLVYFVRGTPSAYLLDERGVVTIPRLDGARAILAAALAAPAMPADLPGDQTTPADRTPAPKLVPLAAGNRLPHFDLPLLDGGRLTDRQLLGRRALLVLFDPRCEPCLELLPHLAVAARRGTLPLVLLSRREPELTLRALASSDLDCPVALQPGWDYSRRLGLVGTPAACLLDAQGRLEQNPVSGKPGVESLLTQLGARAPERRLVSLTSLLK